MVATQPTLGLSPILGPPPLSYPWRYIPIVVVTALETTDMARTAQERPSGTPDEMAPMAFLSFGDTAVGLQKDLLQAYQRLNRIWLERMQVEVALWTRFVSDLTASRSDTDFLKACTDHMTRQFRMNAEDCRHVFSDYQEILRKSARTDADDEPAIRDPGSDAELDFGPEQRVTH